MTHSEMLQKAGRVRAYLEREGLAALALQSPANVAWITGGGDSHIQITAEDGAATIVVTRDKTFLISANIERARMLDEEVTGLDIEMVQFDWHEGDHGAALLDLVPSGEIASDSGIAGSKKVASDIYRLQAPLLDVEVARYRELGATCGRILGDTMRAVEPAMTEHDVAAMLAERAHRENVLPAVILVAADERILRYRHPIPTGRTIDRYVMGVLVGRKWGLYSSETRLVHFGRPSDDLRRRHEACVRVDATLIGGTVPGARVGEIVAKAIETYAESGFADEWRLHHQGGATGYAARTYKGVPGSEAVVGENEAFAWNPSITGTKSEDTILATADGPQVLSATPDWPTIEAETEDGVLLRPDILSR